MTGIRDSNLVEHERTRDALAGGLWDIQAQARFAQEAQTKKELLQSLVFSDMLTRQDQIKNVNVRAYDFMFTNYTSASEDWNSPIDRDNNITFTEWLSSEGDLFWIGGKAGAGKSTLMQCLFANPQALELYQVYCDAQGILGHPLSVAFFFWNSETPMQRTMRGLLQSLLYQILSQDDRACQRILQSQSMCAPYLWQVSKLEELLRRVLDQLSHPFLIFLDGLDKFADGEGALLSIVDIFRRRSGVKICVSSRPHERFVNHFSREPQLQFHLLSPIVIRKSAVTQINDAISLGAKHDDSDSEADYMPRSDRQDIAFQLAENADGIFLWAHLAMESIMSGIRCRDPVDVLISRLEDVLPALDNIYKQKWVRFQTDLARYFVEAR